MVIEVVLDIRPGLKPAWLSNGMALNWHGPQLAWPSTGMALYRHGPEPSTYLLLTIHMCRQTDVGRHFSNISV